MDQPPATIKGILFDLDGTLYRMIWYLKPLLALRLLPKSLRLPRYLRVRKTFAGKEMESGQALLRAMAEALGRATKTGTEEMLAWIENTFYPAFISVMPLMRGARPGLPDLLAKVKRKGIRIGVLSDFAHIEERLTCLDISPTFFDTLVSSEAAGCLKPSPKPFLGVADAWKMDPSHILVVGDRNDTDGTAAGASGMRFLQITDSPRQCADTFRWRQVKKYLLDLPAPG